MKKLLSIILIMISGIIFSQNVGDYLSIGNGSWTAANVWSVYNGVSYVPITTTAGVTIGSTTYKYPGSPAAPTSNVVINGHTITTGAGTYSVGNVTVKNNTTSGILQISGNFTLSTTKKLTIDGGTVSWTSASALTLTPADATISIINSGTITNPTCNANTKLVIGTVTYASCSGPPSGTYTLISNVNSTSGGTLLASINPPTGTILSPGQTLNLTGSYTGYVEPAATVSYTWTGTGPGGLTYSGTGASYSPGALTSVGYYTFTLKVSSTNNGVAISNTQTVTIEVTSCPTGFDSTVVDNFVGTYHSGALKGSDGKWYGWGENMPSGGAYKEINNANGYLPSGVTAVKVSGASSSDGFNQLVILGSNGKIYARGAGGQVLLNTNDANAITIPNNPATGTTYAATDVKSFFASYHTIAIVTADGRGYTWTQQAYTVPKGDGTTADGWSAAVKSDAVGNPVITNFIQIRGDVGTNTGYIGLTSDGKIYVWGEGIFMPSATQSTTLPTGSAAPYAQLINNMPSTTGKAVLVQMNYAGGNGTASYYFMTDNKELWSVGKNNNYQLGTTTGSGTTEVGSQDDAAAWVRVKKPLYSPDGTVVAWTNADVIFFSTEEHDATSDNTASTMYVTTNGSLYGFGTSSFGLLANGTTAASPPKIALIESATPGTFVPMDGSTPRQTATFIEVGGHISFVVKQDGSTCIAGHGKNGSLLGNLSAAVNDQQFEKYFTTSCDAKPNPPCPIRAAVAAPVANNDTFTVAQGASSTSVLANDSNGGTTATTSTVNLTWVTAAPTGFTLNNDGTISVGSTALVGTYQITYQICDIVNTTSCATAVATITVAPCGPTEAATTYAISTTKSDPYSAAAGTKIIYDVTSANATAEIKLTTGTNVGYNGIAYNYNGTNAAYSASSGGYNTSGTTFTNKSIRIQGVALSTAGNNNDVLQYTVDPQNVTAKYTAQVTLKQIVQDVTINGNAEASEYTVTWTGGVGDAILTDTRVTTSTDYQFGVPAGWVNDGEVMGNFTTVSKVAPNNKFTVYAMKNAGAAWSLKFPAGATGITITKTALKNGTSSTAGIDVKYPSLGWNTSNTTGETYAEWMTLTVDLLKTTCATDCYKPATSPGTGGAAVTHGITALQRAAKDNTDTSVWPLKLKGAYTALDAKTKGFVINRMPSAPTTNKGEPVDGTGTAVITAPVKGMAFYDLTNNCISINTDGTRTGWKCFKTPACDQ